MRIASVVRSLSFACIGLALGAAGCGGCGSRKQPPGALASSSLDVSPSPVASEESQDSPADEGDAGEDDGEDASTPKRRARRIEVAALGLGAFVISSEPSAEHPNGVITALAWPQEYAPSSELYAAEIDVATAREVSRVHVGPSDHEDRTMITGGAHRVLIAQQGQSELRLTWLGAGGMMTARQSVAGLGADSNAELRGLDLYEDRIVLATSDIVPSAEERTTMRILDDKGSLVSRHACHGGLFSPGNAQFARIGDEVVLANLEPEYDDHGSNGVVPVCAGRLHGPPRWREVKLSAGGSAMRSIVVHGSAPYFGGISKAKALDENLYPTGPEIRLDETESPPCKGLTGTVSWQEEVVGGAQVVRMVSCCGDPSPGGLFVCEAPSTAPRVGAE